MIGGRLSRGALSEGLDSEALGRTATGILSRLRPADGWIALVLLIANLGVVLLSVEQADWAPTPNLVGVLLLAMLTAMVFHRLPVWSGLALVPGLVLGGLTITWQMSNFVIDGEPLGGAAVLWDRLSLWLEAARAGSINIDKVPFAFGLVTASWLLGYLGGWVFLRHRNFWGVFVLSGLGLFSNLTFLPPNTILHLSLYLFTALLVVARIQAVRRQSQWQRRGITYDDELRSLSLSDSFFLAIAIIVIAIVLPTGGSWTAATTAYESLRKPLVTLEDDFNRLFAGLPARREIGFRVWDDVMAFQGTINPGNHHTLIVQSPVPMYWKARTYDSYNGKGWTSEHTWYRELDYSPEFHRQDLSHDRVDVRYAVTPLYDSNILFGGPRVTEVDRDVEIETPSPPYYRIDTILSDPLPYMPSPWREAGQAVAARVRENPAVSAEGLQPLLPPHFRVIEIQPREAHTPVVLLEEALPDPPEVLSVRSRTGVFGARDTYIVTSSIPTESPEELRAAGTVYPPSILIRHTQLPQDLPERVRSLAQRLTVNAPTPYDKALAVEGYLKGMDYDLEMDPPPFDADGVDHFLFEQRRGYSEYFASAMAVMLRSVGIPARVVVGYTTGQELDEPGLYAVTDSNSHGWVEVYFPGHSWIAFEPTPGAALPVIMSVGQRGGFNIGGSLGREFEFDCIDVFDLECVAPLEGLTGQEGLTFENEAGGGFPAWGWWAIMLGVVAGLAIMGWWGFRRYMASSTEPAVAFGRMLSVAAMSGLIKGSAPTTPHQFGERIGRFMPEQKDRVDIIVESYVQTRYGGRPLTEGEVDRMRGAWQRLRFPLLMETVGQKIFPRSDP